MKSDVYLYLAYGIFLGVILGYFLCLNCKQKKLKKEIADLERSVR